MRRTDGDNVVDKVDEFGFYNSSKNEPIFRKFWPVYFVKQAESCKVSKIASIFLISPLFSSLEFRPANITYVALTKPIIGFMEVMYES